MIAGLAALLANNELGTAIDVITPLRTISFAIVETDTVYDLQFTSTAFNLSTLEVLATADISSAARILQNAVIDAGSVYDAISEVVLITPTILEFGSAGEITSMTVKALFTLGRMRATVAVTATITDGIVLSAGIRSIMQLANTITSRISQYA